MITKIEWCDHTLNPGIYGCQEVSPACKNCYAAVMARRQIAMGNYPEGVADNTGWTGKVVVEYDRVGPTFAKLPKKKPARVFVTSMSDLFHKDVPFGFIDEVFREMEARPHLTFQVLTKRPERMVAWVERAARLGDDDWPENVMAGCTVEDQKRADERIPELLEVPALWHFVSCEPLLGRLDLSPWLGAVCNHEDAYVEYDTNALICRECEESNFVTWVIAGGESGPRTRASDPAWFRDIRDQCASASVAYFHKQMTGKAPIPEDLMVKEFPS